MTIFNRKGPSNEEIASIFFYMTDEELVDKAFRVGREANFERYLLPHEREELRNIRAALISRLRNKNTHR